MREHERELHRNEMADIFIATAERSEHSAIFIHPNPDADTDAEVIESAWYVLAHGAPVGGDIFLRGNCVYPGMRLERYELMLNVWRDFQPE